MEGDIKDIDHILSQLSEIPGYSWDLKTPPFHTSHGYWHFLGTQDVRERAPYLSAAALPPSSLSAPPARPYLKRSQASSISDNTNDSQTLDGSSPVVEDQKTRVFVRISRSILRLEREFHMYQQITGQSQLASEHFLHPLEILYLAAENNNSGHAATVYEMPGYNYIRDITYLGPNFYKGKQEENVWSIDNTFEKKKQVPLTTFLDFAIGAVECCEILHHDNGLVHGQLRGDCFHMNSKTGVVKMVNLGSGIVSLEKDLTSAGWASMNKERGSQFRLQFIAPEQTGRTPSEPDSRTDIYSLGVVFWTMLTHEEPFAGDSPLEVVQGVLSRRIPLLSSKRLDIPDSLSKVIAKMTQKKIDDRYHSTAGLKYDLTQIRLLLSSGDSEELQSFEIATKDISCFFTLPNFQIGREREERMLFNIIEKVSSQARVKNSIKQSHGTMSSASSVSELKNGSNMLNLETSSTATNSPQLEGVANPNGDHVLLSHIPSRESLSSRDLATADVSAVGHNSKSKGSVDLPPNFEKRLPFGIADNFLQRPLSHVSGSEVPSSSLGRSSRRTHQGSCEVVNLLGPGGFGKTTLMQSIQYRAKQYGYIAFSRFEQSKRAPFKPVLKLMASLFNQVFSESDTKTPFHNNMREYLRPLWDTLHILLDLPERLLDSADNQPYDVLQPKPKDWTHNRQPKNPCHNMNNFSANAIEWLRSGGSSRSSRFVSTFIDVLRVLASEKFICFCIDDLQYADFESLELIRNIISGRVSMLLVTSCRSEKEFPAGIEHVLNTCATKIELTPFSEKDVAYYISLTLHRSAEYVRPLAVIVQERSGGNPLSVREILEQCNKKGCIYFSWKTSTWQFDLDRVFQEFASQMSGSQLNNDFIITRLKELPKIARAFLSWASLIGHSFSFEMIKSFMTYNQEEELSEEKASLERPEDPVVGLQSALSAYIIVPTGEDDTFQFVHERYLQSARSLSECYNKAEMHFIIAKYLMERQTREENSNTGVLYDLIEHICPAAGLIKDRIKIRSPFRDALHWAAENASESGARSSSLLYYKYCLELLQISPWDSKLPDTDYQETLVLYTKTAQAYLYQGRFEEAMKIISESLSNVKAIVDGAPFYVIAARVLMSQGKPLAAFTTLRKCLSELGLGLPDTTWGECDGAFRKTCDRIKQVDFEILFINPTSTEPTAFALGSTIVEALSASFWSNSLFFYQLTLKLINMHLDGVNIPQVALGYEHFAWIAVARHKLTSFGIDVDRIAQKFFDTFQYNTYIVGRSQTLCTTFMGHIKTHMRNQLSILDQARDMSIQAGDRVLSMVNCGITAAMKAWSGDNLLEVESFLEEVSVSFLSANSDNRGEIFPTSSKQYVRALLGKTRRNSASTIFSDHAHDQNTYLQLLKADVSNAERLKSIYLSYLIAALFRFDYHYEVISVGEELLDIHDSLWCLPHRYFNFCYLSLSYVAFLRNDPTRANKDDLLRRVHDYTHIIQSCTTENDINYRHWIITLQAEVLDFSGDAISATKHYEAASKHAELHEFTLDLAMIYELYSEALLRQNAERPARRLIQDCICFYRRIGAQGKVDHVSQKYACLLNTISQSTTGDVACQTDFDHNYRTWELELNERQNELEFGKESTSQRTQAWLSPSNALHEKNLETPLENVGSLSATALDVIDLASILESTQVMSSELQVDLLLSKMTEIMLESTGADLAAVIVEDDQFGWAVRAIGTPDGVTGYPDGRSLDTVDDQVAKQITHYVLRMRETVLVQNFLYDERFSNVPDSYLRRFPEGKAIFAIPIIHGDNVLLGSIHVECPPNSFSNRSITVLRLLVNQVSISLANALMFKRLKRISASNAAMIDMQKKTLEQTKESEKKAKESETEAIRNMKVAEEATKAKSLFLANVSHELRTPLNGVLGMSELLRTSHLNSDQEGYADSIRVCADTLLNIINDLLDYSKLEAKKMKMFSVPFSLAETIAEVVRALSYANMGKNVETVEEVDISKNMLVLGDPVRLHQIFMNLLSNSYKFTPNGKVVVRAKVDGESKDWIEVTCSVSDTGIGITEEQKKRLFIPFSQADNSTARHFGGTGLGLSICKAIVDVMKGKIWLDSKPEAGTTVSFSLRLRKVTKSDGSGVSKTSDNNKDIMESRYGDPNPTEHGVENKDISTVARQEVRVCIAEDNPINQKIAISFVQKMGLHCKAFGDGQQAVRALEEAAASGKPFHLVLMDVQMPVMDGYHATREIRKSDNVMVRDVLIIAMTASAIRGDREKCLEAGMNNYLAKPVRSQTLKTVLDTYLAPIKPSDIKDTGIAERSSSNVKSGKSSDDISTKITPKKKAAFSSSPSLSPSSSSNMNKAASAEAAISDRPPASSTTYNSTSPPLLSTPPNADETTAPNYISPVNTTPNDASSNNSTLKNAPTALVAESSDDNKGKDHNSSSTNEESRFNDDRTDSNDPSVRPAPARQETVLRAHNP